MTARAQIILASASPRRYELLQQIGVICDVQAVDIDETVNAGELALNYVQRLAQEKALNGLKLTHNKQALPVLGSDTTIEFEGNIIGKPESRQQAKQMLLMLSGNKHTVHTSVAVVTHEKSLIATSSSQVEFAQLGEAEIEAYLATGEADDKAGAYAIQGIAAQFIKNISGSYSGIMGLPLFETVQLLNQFGIDPLQINQT